MTPIRKIATRASIHPDWELTERQREIAAAFIALGPPTPHEQAAFDAGWENTLKYERVKALKAPIGKRQRKARRRELSRLSHKIVLAHRQAALLSSAPIKRLALRWLRHRGGVEHINIAKFARYVRRRPALERVYASGVASPLSSKRIRAILNEMGIKGKPGRKPKIP